MLFSRTSIVTFPNFLVHESFLVEYRKLPLSLSSFYSYSHCAVKSMLRKGRSFPKQNQTLSSPCAAVLSVLTLLDHCQGLHLFFPLIDRIFWQSNAYSANLPCSGLPLARWSCSDCFLQRLCFYFKAFEKLRKG